MSREGEQLQSGAAESQTQTIPALPILVTAAMGEIAALTAVIPYKTRDMWTLIKQRTIDDSRSAHGPRCFLKCLAYLSPEL